MENNDFEIWSLFTDEIEQWYDDAGGDPTHYDYAGSYDPENASLTAKLVVFSEDAEEVVEELNKTKQDVLGHLATLFPQTKISLMAVTPAGWDESEESPVYTEGDGYVPMSTGSEFVDEDDNYGDEYEDSELDLGEDAQYEEEGLIVVDEDSDEEDFTNIIEQEDAAMAEADDNEYTGERFSTYISDEDAEDEEDDYIPDERDREDLWKSFWVGEDE